MTEKVELLNSGLRFSPFWLVVDGLCMIHLIIAWVFEFKKSRWKVDYWFFTLGMSFAIPVFMMYPFNASIFNCVSCGEDYFRLERFIDTSFAITLLGYTGIWLGRWIYDLCKWKTPFYLLVLFLNPMGRIIQKNIMSKKAQFYLVAFAMTFLGVIFSLQIHGGYLFNPRGFFLKNEALRPIYNAGISILPCALLFLSLRITQYKENYFIFFLVCFFVLSLFLGLRSLTIGSLITVFVYKIFASSGKIQFTKLICYLTGLCFLAIYMENFRYGNLSVFGSLSKFLTSVFYGNNLSDTRDFAWILAYWDGEYVFGKTYLAGLLSFLPRFVSPYRQEWALSVYTNSLVGFDSSVHAGLRPGLFGEVFLNFSYFGVIALGIFAGYMLRHADLLMKRAVELKQGIIKGYAATLPYLCVSSFFLSPGLWGFYVFVIINLFIYFLSRIKIGNSGKIN